MLVAVPKNDALIVCDSLIPANAYITPAVAKPKVGGRLNVAVHEEIPTRLLPIIPPAPKPNIMLPGVIGLANVAETILFVDAPVFP
jgi:hypothetical protein